MNPEHYTAWALNELSDEERAQMEALMQASPEDAARAMELKSFCQFLGEHLVDDDAALDAERRAALVQLPVATAPNVVAFDPEAGPSKLNGRRVRETLLAGPDANTGPNALRWVLGLAACLALSMVILFTADRPAGEKLKVADVLPPEQQPAAEGSEAVRVFPTDKETVKLKVAEAPAAPPPLAGVGSVKGDGSSLALVGAKKEDDALPFKKEVVAVDSSKRTTVPFVKSPEVTFDFGDTPITPPPADPVSGGFGKGMAGAKDPTARAAEEGEALKGKPKMLAQVEESRSKVMAQKPAPAPGVSGASASAAADVFDPPQIPRSIRPDSVDLQGARDPFGTERYAQIVENKFLEPARDPLSTLSIDVDSASYANVRRFLNEGRRPPANAVRLEELINYFPYDYEAPGKESARPFAVQVDVAEAPWAPPHRLARIGIKGREVGQDRQQANFVFLIDVSGSMNEPNKLPLLQRSLGMLTEKLKDDDRVAIVTYAGESGVALESTAGRDRKRIMSVVDSLHAGGSTNGAGGIQLAYELAQRNFIGEGINRVILCTDGDFNVGVSSNDELEKLIKEKAKSGVFLSVLGFGTGNLQDQKMETLADKGNGNYAYIDSLSEARKVLVEQMNGTLVTIAKDVKIQVEFNPAEVRSYRLLGYENRVMAKEDFNNDRKDAGEIGAGHTVTALYEIVPINAPEVSPGPLVDDLKYQPKPDNKLPNLTGVPPQKKLGGINDELMTVKLRYKEPDGQVSKVIEVPVKDAEKTMKASPRDFQFAAAVAGFGLLLRDSEYKGELTWEQVRQLAINGKGEDKLGYRGEFIQLIDKANGLAR